MLPIIKAALSGIKAFAVTTTGKIVIVAVLGTAVIGTAGTATYNANASSAQSQARAAAMTTEATNMEDSDISSMTSIDSTTSVDSAASATEANSAADASSQPATVPDSSSASKSTGNAEIDSAVSVGVQKINSAADEAVSKVQDAAPQPKPGPSVEMPVINYPVINPATGTLVGEGDTGYAQFKAELGGDAGTVLPDESTAIAAARAKLKATSSSPSSTVSK